MPPATMPVTCRGTTYPTCQDAADALGVSIATVYYHLQRGAPDSIGIGKGCNPRNTHFGKVHAKTVEYHGRIWPSRRAFADWAGIPYSRLAGKSCDEVSTIANLVINDASRPIKKPLPRAINDVM